MPIENNNIPNSPLDCEVITLFCDMTVGCFDDYYTCGKIAKWKAPNGANFCTRHKNQADRIADNVGGKHCKAL